jgi:hypothetical protein
VASYSNYVMPEAERTGRWSLTMAWWALFSAMFWLYIAVASAGAVEPSAVAAEPNPA